MSSFLMPRSQHDVNLWVVPLKMSLGAVLLFALTMIPDTLAAYKVIHLPYWFTMGSIDDARAILSAMLGCVSTVLALIFSVALLVLSMVATLFGPRLLYRFVQDRVTQATIGLFMGAFIYVFLVFLVTHQDPTSTFIPQVSLITSWFVVLAAFAFLVYYSHRIAVSIQNPDAVGRIVDDSRRALDVASRRAPGEGSGEPVSAELIQRQMAEGGIVKSNTGGYMQEVEHQELVAAAAKADAVIHVLFRPGQFVLEGEPLACVWPESRLAPLAEPIEKHVKIGRHRILKQDSEFGVAQIVEIAIRALSPAINDTFTGIACVDWLGQALTVLSETPQGGGCWYDSDGRLRVRQRELRITRLVKQAFDQVRQAGADNPAILIRMLNTIGRIAPRLQNVEERTALMEQAAAIWETATSRGLVKMDRDDIEAAWQKTRDVLTGLLAPVSPRAA
jgi:uncharacterized membrane protein